MKTRLCSAVSLILIASLFGLPTLSQTKTQRKNPLRNIRAKSLKGPKVKEKIEQLRATHSSVRAALEAFERKGHRPKIEDAVSVTGSVDVTREVANRRTHHATQQTTVTGDGVELIFITVVDLYNEWQGITIANFYDANGALEEQYVADVVITRSEYSPSDWTARFELKFESDGIGYLNHRPGMFTNFNLGTPVQQQTAPLSLDPSQFASTGQMDAYYNLYPGQVLIDYVQGGGDGGGEILPIPARFARPQGRFGPPVSPWTFYTITGWGATAKDVGIGCSLAAGACSVGVLLGGSLRRDAWERLVPSFLSTLPVITSESSEDRRFKVSKKRVILAVVLPVTGTIVFAWAKLTPPLRDAIVICVAAFVGSLVGYIWAWKRGNLTFTFGRMILWALVVAGVAAAMIVISNLLASYVF